MSGKEQNFVIFAMCVAYIHTITDCINFFYNIMTEKINFKNMLMMALMLLSSVAFTSCLGDDTDKEVEISPMESGLCGFSWELASITGVDEEELTYEKYTFELDGSGVLEYEDEETGELKESLFTWKAYAYNNNKTIFCLEIQYKDYGDLKFITYYTITDIGQLCMEKATNAIAYYNPV